MKRKFPLFVLLGASLLFACSPTTSSSSPSESLSIETGHKVDLDLSEPPLYEEDAISFHYYRKDGVYQNWDFWLWENNGGEGKAYSFNGKDDWGVIASYPLSTWTDAINNGLGFIVRKGGSSWTSKDCGGEDLFVDFSSLDKDEKGVYHVYLISGDANVYIDKEGNMKGKLKYATFATNERVAVLANLGISRLVLKENGVTIATDDKVGGSIRADISLPKGHALDYAATYSVEVTLKNGDVLTGVIAKNSLFGEDDFGSLYNYDGDDLGAIYGETETKFAVWSPLSSSIKLRIYASGTPKSLGGDDVYEEFPMEKTDKGVFRYAKSGNLEGKYYTYLVSNSSYSDKEIVDPYAKGCGVNGLRGMIVDFNKTNPEGWDEVSPLPLDRKAMVVYETHVADVTSSSTWTGTEKGRKKFLGMYESGTTYSQNGSEVKTGFDHIKELGVNAVQLLPIFDQANDEINVSFNWGYNPLNYNCLEGAYSSDPKDGYARIKEFKGLVKAYRDANINIIMDVVYNHVNGATGSSFDVLMPGYYFRYTGMNALSNGSGCGNETASEHFMMRKFMKDSVAFWAKEYKLGGFRFDLMGLHDLETMKEISEKAMEVNPNIVIYGEPWQGGTSTLSDTDSAKQINGNRYEGYGAFNDQLRDALIRGGLSGDKDLGWVTNMSKPIEAEYQNKLLSGVKGTVLTGATTIADPDKTVSYVTCHDNYTLYDRIKATGIIKDEEVIEKMNALANNVVLTSQGTSFLLAGEEMLRSKNGDKNSYSSSYQVNELDYSLKIKHPSLFKNYQKMIALKKNCNLLHLDKEGIKGISPTLNAKGSVLQYVLEDKATGKTIKIIHGNALAKGETVDLEGYRPYWSSANGETKELTKTTDLSAYETIVAEK